MSKQRGIGQRGGSRLIGSAIICLLAGYALAQAPEPAAAETSETVPEPVAAPTLDEKLDALLGETLAADEYGESRHCLHRSAYRRVEIINQEFLLFSKQGTYYLNRLKRKCPGLRRNLLLTFTMWGNSVCRSDIVYVSDRFGSSFRATCHLGEFELIEEQQALALKAAL
ncbi:MAG: hypothetical protein V3T18_06985 [Pseudomonadales bacterium]